VSDDPESRTAQYPPGGAPRNERSRARHGLPRRGSHPPAVAIGVELARANSRSSSTVRQAAQPGSAVHADADTSPGLTDRLDAERSRCSSMNMLASSGLRRARSPRVFASCFIASTSISASRPPRLSCAACEARPSAAATRPARGLRRARDPRRAGRAVEAAGCASWHESESRGSRRPPSASPQDQASQSSREPRPLSWASGGRRCLLGVGFRSSQRAACPARPMAASHREQRLRRRGSPLLHRA
jgi:hypothetical protein